MANNSKLLSHSEMLNLIELSQQGDNVAMEKIVVHNIALVKSLIVKFSNRGLDYDDLFQLGTIGLIRAVKNFNTEFNVQFSTYAVPMILGEVRRYFRDNGSIKVSRSLKEISSRAMKTSELLKEKLSREPTIQEIAKEMDMSVEDIIFALDSAKTPLSLNDKAYNSDNNNETTILESIVDKSNPQDEIIDKLLLHQILQQLKPRDRQIIFLRYFKDQTQSQVAKALGISQVQVSRLETKILSALKALIC